MTSFEDYCKAEPQLEELRDLLQDVAFWYNDDLNERRRQWNGWIDERGFKSHMMEILRSKWTAPEIKQPGAYAVIYRAMWKTLTGRVLE